MVGGHVNPVISVIIDSNNDNNNDKCSQTSTSAFKIFLRKYNSLYAEDLDREKVPLRL